MSITPLSRLWSHARDALTRFRASLFPLDTFSKHERRKLNSWLAALESFVRRVVLLEALNMDNGRLDRGPSLSAEARRAKAEDPLARKARTQRGKRRPRLRLWPAPKRTGPRIRQLGPPPLVREIWREQRRAALIARLQAARGRRRAPHILIADRIDALESLLAAPTRAARRLARKLKQTPRLALQLAMAPSRAARWLDDALQGEAQNAVFAPSLALDSS